MGRKPLPEANCQACRDFLAKYPWIGHEHRGADFLGMGRWASPISCAFDEAGVFRPDNWMCASLTPIVQRAWDNELTVSDQHSALLLVNLRMVLLSYYKRRGNVEGAWVVEEHVVRPLRVDDLELRPDDWSHNSAG